MNTEKHVIIQEQEKSVNEIPNSINYKYENQVPVPVPSGRGGGAGNYFGAPSTINTCLY